MKWGKGIAKMAEPAGCHAESAGSYGEKER